jgi:hypothetical protein
LLYSCKNLPDVLERDKAENFKSPNVLASKNALSDLAPLACRIYSSILTWVLKNCLALTS